MKGDAAVITARWVEGDVVRSGALTDIPVEPSGTVWVDVVAPDEAALIQVSKRFPLPPLAREDCLRFPQRPKLDVYGSLTFLVWQIPHLTDDLGVEVEELDVFLGEEHLVTVHRDPMDVIIGVADHALAHPEQFQHGAEWILHAILDTAVDSVLPIIERLSDDLEELEDRMFEQVLPKHQQELYVLRRALVRLHRVVTPERDVVRTLARLEAFVEPDAYMYFEDIGDHLARVADEVDTYRDVANGTMDIFLSAQSNRMNAIMKTLTVVATIFMPLTLLSGIYGMNFGYIPGLSLRYGFFIVLAVMLVVALVMVNYFRRHNWW